MRKRGSGKKRKPMPAQYRQGDVLLCRIKKIPGCLQPLSEEGGRVVVLAANVVPTPQWFRALLELPLAKDTLYVDDAEVAVIESGEPSAILAAATRCRTLADLVTALRGTVAVVDRALEPRGRFPLATRADLPRAETWLLGSLVKRGEGQLQATEVKVGALAGDYDEVLAGLNEGEEVATQATFLLSSEAQLRSALPRWGQP